METDLFGNPASFVFTGKTATYSAGRGELFHDWFPYLEGFSSEFVKDILSQKFDSPKRILEPFCGVGTTPLTLAQMGISCGYCEVNPFLLELVNAKSSLLQLDAAELQSLSMGLLELNHNLNSYIKAAEASAELLSAFSETFGEVQYFSEPNKTLVLKLKTIENQHVEEKLRPFFRVVVATSLLKSSLLRRAGDVRYKTKRELAEGIPDILPLIETKIQIICRDIKIISEIRARGAMHLVCDNAKKLSQISGKKFDGVITSPPYLNGTNYIRNTKLELWFLGYLNGKQDMRHFRESVVTSAINDVSKTSGVNVIDEAADIVKKIESNCYDKRIPRMVSAYFEHMKQVSNGIYKNVRKNAPVCIDIGDSVYGGEHVPTHDILEDIFKSVGFNSEGSVVLRKRFSNQGAPLTQRLLFFRKK